LGLTGQEVAFLLLGMLVGSGIGATIAIVVRRRTEPKREVRVTVAPNAIPRRPAATLAHDGIADPSRPARGGPADPWPELGADALPPLTVRTSVRSIMGPGLVFAAPAGAGGAASMVPVPMGGATGGRDQLLGSLTRRTHSEMDRPAGLSTAAATAVLDRPQPFTLSGLPPPTGEGGPPRAAAAAADAADPPTAPLDAPAPDSPCGELRTVADERCEVASRARVEAERAQETLRAAQRSYDEHLLKAEHATRTSDPRTIRAAKDEAQRTFRASRSGAANREDVDAAARDWLLEINRINQEARTATSAAAREQESARSLAGSLDRLTVEADAARITAETADEACLNARQAAADCEESLQAPASSEPAMPSGAPSGLWTDEPGMAVDPGSALGAMTAPTIFRLLQGDRVALAAVVDRLAGEDPTQRRAWQGSISNLVDAILSTAIEASALEFPEDDFFWAPFTLAQSRDIVAGLASLGYRFDGMGGWLDGRVPSQRDLALALGYAGMDPMRIRRWPNETEMAELFKKVRVAAAEYLALSAGDLTLGELVTMLGPRADALADVWNAWGRIRPLLLEER
jgi:hypothetical protein